MSRLGIYYAFWLPIAAAVIVLEVAWRLMLVDTLAGMRRR